jgi:hypothetical protein
VRRNIRMDERARRDIGATPWFSALIGRVPAA